MSTRSYVGIIDYEEDGKVRYGYHHSDSYLEDLGIELFKGIKENSDVHKLPDFAEVNSLEETYTTTKDDFFNITERDIFIEFCYAFDMTNENWYVSSSHFKDNGKVHKLTDVIKDDNAMKEYLSMYYEQYRESILKQIRENIK